MQKLVVDSARGLAVAEEFSVAGEKLDSPMSGHAATPLFQKPERGAKASGTAAFFSWHRPCYEKDENNMGKRVKNALKGLALISVVAATAPASGVAT